MRNVTIVLLMATVTAMFYLFAFTEIIAPIAKAALLLVPAIFTVSLVVGLFFRVRNWFE